MYDESPNPPLLFANQLIVQFVQHMLGGDVVIEANDFTVIRVAFRKIGGSWEDLVGGDLQQVELLKKVVTTWGTKFKHKSKDDEVI